MPRGTKILIIIRERREILVKNNVTWIDCILKLIQFQYYLIFHQDRPNYCIVLSV
jgi:hypothetical protein